MAEAWHDGKHWVLGGKFCYYKWPRMPLGAAAPEGDNA
jgi:hypothetical protein